MGLDIDRRDALGVNFRISAGDKMEGGIGGPNHDNFSEIDH